MPAARGRRGHGRRRARLKASWHRPPAMLGARVAALPRAGPRLRARRRQCQCVARRRQGAGVRARRGAAARERGVRRGRPDGDARLRHRRRQRRRNATSATAAKKKPAVVSWQVGSREARRAFYCKWHIVKSFEVYASAPRSTVRPAMMMSSPRRSSSASASSRRVRCSLLLPAAARRWRRAAAVVERSSSGRRGGGRRRRRPGTPKQECEVCNGISIPGAGSGSRRREARAPLGLVPFSAFWLRSSVVSVLISVKTGNPSNAWVYFHMYF